MKTGIFEKRIRTLRGAMEKKRLTHFLVTALKNVRYLSGFTGSNGTLLVTPEKTFFFSDSRYEEQSQTEVSGCEIRIIRGGPYLKGIAKTIREKGPKRLGFEGANMTVASLRSLERLLGKKIRLVFTTSLVSELRELKDEAEIAALERGAHIVDEAFRHIRTFFREGVTEIEVQRELDAFMTANGAEAPSFPTIVLFGARASLPHGKPGSSPLKPGDFILMDYGARVDGYCSDFTRTLAFREATSEMKKVYELVRKAQRAAIEKMKPGMKQATVDQVARGVIEAGGYGECFSHSLGHSVGLDIHEEPRLSPMASGTLRKNHLYTVEPGIYVPGWGGVRIEDMVLVTGKGAKRLTKAERKLVVV